MYFPADSKTSVENWRHFNKLVPTHFSQEKENSRNRGSKCDSAMITWFCNIQYLESQHKNGTKEGKVHDDS